MLPTNTESKPKCQCSFISIKSDSSASNTKYLSRKLFCPECVKEFLKPALRERRKTLSNRNEKRQWCAERLLQIQEETKLDGLQSQTTNKIDRHGAINKKHNIKNPSQLKYEYNHLNKQLTNLRHETQNLSLRLTSLQVSNDSRETILNHSHKNIENAKFSIQKIYQNCALDGLNNSLRNQKDKIRKLRLRLVLQIFDMHKIEIGEETEKILAQWDNENIQNKSSQDKITGTSHRSSKSTRHDSSKKNPKGYSKIAGLPLPNAGQMYYALFPSVIITSSLRLVASVTYSIARCFNIDLPHPILLRPGIKIQHDIIKSDCDEKESNIEEEYKDTELVGNDEHKWDENDATSFVKKDSRQNVPSTYRFFTRNPATTKATNLMTKIIPPRLSDIRRAWIGDQQQVTTSNVKLAIPTSSTTGKTSLSSGSQTNSTSSVTTTATTTTTTTSNDEVLISVIDKPYISSWSQHYCYTPEQYISHAAHAVLRENQGVKNESVTEYSLIYRCHDKSTSHQLLQHQQQLLHKMKQSANEKSKPLYTARNNQHHDTEDHFSIGLQLLQNDIIALCIRAGVPVDKLWPAEAMLLNLHSLWIFCCTQLTIKQKP